MVSGRSELVGWCLEGGLAHYGSWLAGMSGQVVEVMAYLRAMTMPSPTL